ncbi:hypothetical protein BJ165DRAFT_1463037 [Panaeolus papilionaceus]|nr:hypothetical protein BJ165DRAFT_1463037 [Panaeolus papilionaceus]
MQTGQALQGNPYFPSAIQNINAFDMQPFIPNMYQSDAMQGIVDMSSLHPSIYNNNRPGDFLHASNIFNPSGSNYSSSPSSAPHPFSPSPSASSMYNRSPSAPLPSQSMLNFTPDMNYVSSMSAPNMTFMPGNPTSDEQQFSNDTSGHYTFRR